MLSPATTPLPAVRPHRSAPAVPEPYAADGQPFDGAEEAWFWAVQAQDAKAAGARVVAGRGLVERPCEPQDVLRVVDRLYRARRLQRDHLHVLVHYGRRLSAPDAERFREQRAHALWREAFDVIAPALRDKGIAR
ncbi:hypothetical protein [Azospirillum sp. TSO35-2]|uniref:hypothetical protein n=1 Tax=Azospirillum sp. TSO35-2 TaxID=716796 RepID=UPI000D615DFE|nr:hypothetical protein [Azospirillum sp. TSO35-2]PWC36653.1 hypothetical protein TSO352_15220 [Azospirillum sp. TSO35-2]